METILENLKTSSHHVIPLQEANLIPHLGNY